MATSIEQQNRHYENVLKCKEELDKLLSENKNNNNMEVLQEAAEKLKKSLKIFENSFGNAKRSESTLIKFAEMASAAYESIKNADALIKKEENHAQNFEEKFKEFYHLATQLNTMKNTDGSMMNSKEYKNAIKEYENYLKTLSKDIDNSSESELKNLKYKEMLSQFNTEIIKAKDFLSQYEEKSSELEKIIPEEIKAKNNLENLLEFYKDLDEDQKRTLSDVDQLESIDVSVALKSLVQKDEKISENIIAMPVYDRESIIQSIYSNTGKENTKQRDFYINDHNLTNVFLKGMLKDTDLSPPKEIIIPVRHKMPDGGGYHYTALNISLKESENNKRLATISYTDSFGTIKAGDDFLKKITEGAIQFCKDKGFDTKEAKLIATGKQKDTHNCGIFAVYNGLAQAKKSLSISPTKNDLTHDLSNKYDQKYVEKLKEKRELFVDIVNKDGKIINYSDILDDLEKSRNNYTREKKSENPNLTQLKKYENEFFRISGKLDKEISKNPEIYSEKINEIKSIQLDMFINKLQSQSSIIEKECEKKDKKDIDILKIIKYQKLLEKTEKLKEELKEDPKEKSSLEQDVTLNSIFNPAKNITIVNLVKDKALKIQKKLNQALEKTPPNQKELSKLKKEYSDFLDFLYDDKKILSNMENPSKGLLSKSESKITSTLKSSDKIEREAEINALKETIIKSTEKLFDIKNKEELSPIKKSYIEIQEKISSLKNPSKEDLSEIKELNETLKLIIKEKENSIKKEEAKKEDGSRAAICHQFDQSKKDNSRNLKTESSENKAEPKTSPRKS